MRKSQEIRNRIVVADIFHHLFQKLQVRRVLPVFHPVSDLIAENPAEIFVAREGEEAAGVGQLFSPDRATQRKSAAACRPRSLSARMTARVHCMCRMCS